MKVENERIWVRFTTERRDKLQEMANKVGLPLSQFVALAAWSGANFVMMALDPSIYTVLKAKQDEEMAEMYEDMMETQQQEAIDFKEFIAWKRQRDLEAIQS